MVTKVQAVVFRDLIIRKALKAVQLGGENAEELLLGTAIQESELNSYIRKVEVNDIAPLNVRGFEIRH